MGWIYILIGLIRRFAASKTFFVFVSLQLHNLQCTHLLPNDDDKAFSYENDFLDPTPERHLKLKIYSFLIKIFPSIDNNSTIFKRIVLYRAFVELRKSNFARQVMQAAQLIVEQREKIEIYDLCFPDVQCHSNIYVDFDSIRHRREEAAKQRYPLSRVWRAFRSEIKIGQMCVGRRKEIIYDRQTFYGSS